MKYLAILTGAVAMVVAAGTANADSVGLYAYGATGKLAKAGKFSKWTRVYQGPDFAKLKARTKKRYSIKITFCDKPYHARPIHKSWIAAHQKAKHKIYVRARRSKGKLKRICKI